MPSDRLALLVSDPALRRRLGRVAEAAGLTPVEHRSLDGPGREAGGGQPPTAIVLQLEIRGAIEAIADWKRSWPDTFVAAAASLPDQERWLAASAAGCDLVLNRGALPARLRKALAARRAGAPLVPPRTRLAAKPALCDGDGLVGRVPDAPDGAIAVFAIGEELCAIRDICPHAGQSLADGELADGVVTCPLHGSRFDVRTGQRLRGPADYPIQTYRAGRDGEGLYVEV